MSTFALRKVEVVKAKQELDELVIDGVGQLAAFEELLATDYKQYISEFRTMLTYVEYAANGNTLPDTRFKDVTPTGVLIKEYEFKSKHLRLYAIKQLNGKVIVLGGLKTTQKSDFKRFRSLKELYLNSL